MEGAPKKTPETPEQILNNQKLQRLAELDLGQIVDLERLLTDDKYPIRVLGLLIEAGDVDKATKLINILKENE